MPAIPSPSSSTLSSTAPLFIKTLLVRRPLLTQPLSPLAQHYYPYQFQLYNAQARLNSSEFWVKPNTIPTLDDTHSNTNSTSTSLFNTPSSSPPPPPPTTTTTIQRDQDKTKLTRKLHDFLFLLIQTTSPSSSTSSSTSSQSTSNSKNNSNSHTQPQTELSNTNSTWDLVMGQVESNEPLHKAAQRSLRHHCGNNMEIWMVGRAPIAISHLQPNTYIHKAHILAGEPQSLGPSSSSLTKYIWVTAEEMPQYLSKERFDDIKDLLS